MRAALELFEQLEITYVPSSEARLHGPMVTCCGNVTERLIRSHGIEHATIVLRTIIETEGNSGELIANIIFAISDIVVTHPRWVGLGLRWLEAFDQISLAAIRRSAKGRWRCTAAQRSHGAALCRAREASRPQPSPEAAEAAADQEPAEAGARPDPHSGGREECRTDSSC